MRKNKDQKISKHFPLTQNFTLVGARRGVGASPAVFMRAWNGKRAEVKNASDIGKKDYTKRGEESRIEEPA